MILQALGKAQSGIIGSSSTSNDTATNLINGMVTARAEDGEKCCIVFTDEDAAKIALEKSPNKETLCVKLVADPKDLDLVLQFFEQSQGIRNVLIGKANGQWAIATIAALRFNIALED